MIRYLLPGVTAALLVLIVVDRVRHEPATVRSVQPAALGAEAASGTPPREARHAASRRVYRVPRPAALPAPAVAPPAASPDAAASPVVPPEASGGSRGATPTIDRLARLAVRRELGAEAGRTYLDSLLLVTDSVVRRWPERGTPLTVALVERGAAGDSTRVAELVRQALDRWTDANVGVRFTDVTDTANADIVVHWIERFDFDRAGQTDLTWDHAGRVRRASILLALKTSDGTPLNDVALLAVAVHETGHAIGLPHSADPNDVMYPSTRTATLSARDVRTASVLYRLPLGTVRDAPDR
ncbi:MAG TPA: matrixin family metalloprotease [Gemmatimonadales bacterium]|nr:matrixin family metalloprotease [Gemmatimonadales bacterium]